MVQTPDQSTHLPLYFRYGFVGRCKVKIRNVPIHDSIRPSRKAGFEIRTVLIFVQNNDQIGLGEVSFLQLHRRANLPLYANAPCLQPFKGIRGNRANIPEAQFGREPARDGSPTGIQRQSE